MNDKIHGIGYYKGKHKTQEYFGYWKNGMYEGFGILLENDNA